MAARRVRGYTGATVMERRAPRGILPGAALLLAIPAVALTGESFRPFALRVAVEGRSHVQSFALPERTPLYLEYELVVRADGDRPRVVITVNGAPAATLQASSAFATERGRVLLPLEPLRDGENELRVALEPASEATVDLRARLHNYYGIAPDFPRAAVVADEAVAHRLAQQTFATRAGRVVAIFLMCLGLVWALTRLHPPRRPGGVVLLAVPALLPWAALAYSLATPLHLWLSVPAMLVVAIVPWALARAGLWLAARGPAVRQAVAIAAVCALSLEGALRLFNHFVPTFLFYSDSYNRFRGQPGAPHYDAVFNSRGFNDVERQAGRPPGVRRRVVAIGDSFAVGSVPRGGNYLTLLERSLSDKGPVEVVNMGVSGTAPADYLSLLVDEGLAAAPDLVLVGFYIGNDFEARARRLHEYSYLATLVRAVWRLGTARSVNAPSGDPAATYDDTAPTMPRERFLEIQVDRAPLYERAAASLESRARGAADALRQMRDLSQRAGADLLVVLIPDEIQVDEALLAEVARARGRTPDDFDVARPTRAIAAALERAGVPFLDLGPPFLARAGQESLYKPRDTHWNLAGNRLAAEVLAPAVRARLDARPTR